MRRLKTIIIYYTFGGETRKEAKRLAGELGVGTTIYEVKEAKERSVLGSLVWAAGMRCGAKRRK